MAIKSIFGGTFIKEEYVKVMLKTVFKKKLSILNTDI